MPEKLGCRVTLWAEVNKKEKKLGLKKKREGDRRRAFNFKRLTNGKNNFVKSITDKI